MKRRSFPGIPIRMAVAVALGLLLGFGVRKALPQRDPAAGSSEVHRNPKPLPDIPAPTPRPSKTQAHTLEAIKHRLRNRVDAAPAELRTNIERMTTPDLRDLLVRLDTVSPDLKTDSGAILYADMLAIAISEVYRRDAEGSMQWARTLKVDGAEGTRVFRDLLLQAARTEPSLACRWIQSCRAERGDQWAEKWLSTAKIMAFDVSAEGVLELGKVSRDKNNWDVRAAFADDFDFKLFVSECPLEGLNHAEGPVAIIAKYWAAKDPEAAYVAFKEWIPENRSLFSLLYSGVCVSQSEEVAAHWARAKLDDLSLPADQRQACIASLAYGGGGQGIKGLMAAFSDDPDCWVFAADSFNAEVTSEVDVSGLQMLGSEGLQVKALIRNVGLNFPRDRVVAWNGFQTAMDKLGFSSASREEVRSSFDERK